VQKVKHLFYILTAFSFLFLAASCERIKDSTMAKYYHNMVAHYNIFFNAEEDFKMMVQNTEENHIDDYNTVLDVYMFGDPAKLKGNASVVDDIYERCSKIIDKHKVSKWVDDSYFLIGKSFFYKADYFAALESFNYVISRYNESEMAYEALIWKAWTLIQIEKLDEARALLTLLKSDAGFPKKFKKELGLTEAMINIRQDDYRSAAANLEKAIPLERKRNYKTRYMFIHAQLLQRIDEKSKAIPIYENVIRRNPAYIMNFQSKMEIARCIDTKSEKATRDVIVLLQKMLKDDKNIQYLDQIYFEIALLQLKIGDNKLAKENFLLCIENSKGNANQKAIAYLRLAEYYYDEQEFELSKAYFDSTEQFITKDYPGYEDVLRTNKVLGELVNTFVTVKTEDSLQELGLMTEADRDKKINEAYAADQRQKQLEAQKERERKLREEQEMRMNRNRLQDRNMMQPPGNMSVGNQGGAKFYFYNRSTVDMGKSEFAVKWGKRTLEDHWRRKNRAGASENLASEVDSATEEKEEAVVVEMTEEEKKIVEQYFSKIPKEKQGYYLNIPITESQMQTSHNKIIAALKKRGDIYIEKMLDTLSGTEAYEELLRRYPVNRYSTQMHYNLYNIYKTFGDIDKSNIHKDTILINYPESDYAILIKDPDYFKNQKMTMSKEIEGHYSTTYMAYLSGNCNEVEKRVKESKERFGSNYKSDQYAYLLVLCQGKSKSDEVFAKDLLAFKSTVDDKEIQEHAQLLIDYLNNEFEVKEEEFKIEEEVEKVDSFILKTPYKLNNNANHFVIYSFESRKYNTNQIKVAFSNYNSIFHSSEGYGTTNVIYDELTQFIIVKDFKNKEAAEKYAEELRTDKDFLRNIKNNNPVIFSITQQNFSTLIGKKALDNYKEYYRRYY
jgi:tetratricopeptide (TPR) repeat protein